MYEYEVGDLLILKNEISYLARRYHYLQNNDKLFLDFQNIDNDDLFIVVKKINEFSPNSITLFDAKKGFIIEAYPHIFVKIS